MVAILTARTIVATQLGIRIDIKRAVVFSEVFPLIEVNSLSGREQKRRCHEKKKPSENTPKNDGLYLKGGYGWDV